MVIESPLESIPGVRKFRLVAGGDRLRVLVEPRSPSVDIGPTVKAALATALTTAGVAPEAAEVEVAAALDDVRGRTDKRRRV